MSFQKAVGLNLTKTERFFYLQSGLKHNTSMCALQLPSVNVYDLFFFHSRFFLTMQQLHLRKPTS